LVQSRKMDAEHELWSASNGILFIVCILILCTLIMYGFDAFLNMGDIKRNWGDYRCNPMIMPFAGLFDYDAKDNFNFCMGKVFEGHSQSYLGSFGTMFTQFTSLLQNVFNSISSMRNVIASLGGGINVIFQEFTNRITNFFFKLRLSAIRLKSLFMKMYAILFSVMYMGMSGITGMTSFTNTFLFSFLDTFCFPGDTELYINNVNERQMTIMPIKDIKLGDRLLPGNAKVTATFKFYAKGQPMVKLGSVIVSTNHYIMYLGKPIKACNHPAAIPFGTWDSDEPLYCLNTTTHKIPVKYMTFMDYDETPRADHVTMNYIDGRINARNCDKMYPFKEYGFGVNGTTCINTGRGYIPACDIVIGDKLSTGSEVIGIIHRIVNEICILSDGVIITPSTLYWNGNSWIRLGEHTNFIIQECSLVSFIVVPNSQIELENGMIVRDYMELCSPDAEMHYTAALNSGK
jgi:hypothetical protein